MDKVTLGSFKVKVNLKKNMIWIDVFTLHR